ncbi:DNA-binding transcriptional regulator, FadR family [Paracoccus isoporae]|uniref:DNA-binding transcriptional regulator, FadR family n=1 Tax=Paracoccus isoporae TaxID=591205 RepID=A0A1G7H0G4_9RHOB|nr:FadR/GntR family transcriptional regulator [Paracoccus isoporae]SDE93845.1 DNA-binding transcriptional regulator, FadR family [Paracoccus isoporae]
MGKRKPLSTLVWEDLSEKIASGALQPGAQLPTEAELCAEYEVSRTVVREAIARLRSAGQVIPQQGRGMFVSEAPVQATFQIPEEELQTLAETIALLELRLSVEVEAAGLCAERRTDAEAQSIAVLMDEVDSAHADPSVVLIHYDYDFHLHIAKAARNGFMLAFLEYLRPLIVPRHQLGQIVSAELKDSYYARIHDEHQRIVAAIVAGDPQAARDAMRAHLLNSLERMKALGAAVGVRSDRSPDLEAARALFSGLSKPGAA